MNKNTPAVVHLMKEFVVAHTCALLISAFTKVPYLQPAATAVLLHPLSPGNVSAGAYIRITRVSYA